MTKQMPEEVQAALAKEVAAFIIITGLPQESVIDYTYRIAKIVCDYIVEEYVAETPEEIVRRVVEQHMAMYRVKS